VLGRESLKNHSGAEKVEPRILARPVCWVAFGYLWTSVCRITAYGVWTEILSTENTKSI
jgi:hypothetical protein